MCLHCGVVYVISAPPYADDNGQHCKILDANMADIIWFILSLLLYFERSQSFSLNYVTFTRSEKSSWKTSIFTSFRSRHQELSRHQFRPNHHGQPPSQTHNSEDLSSTLDHSFSSRRQQAHSVTISTLFAQVNTHRTALLSVSKEHDFDQSNMERISIRRRLWQVVSLPFRWLYRWVKSRKDTEPEDVSTGIELDFEISLSDANMTDSRSVATNEQDANHSTTQHSDISTEWLSYSATAAEGVDLSGDWDLIVTESFKKEYDQYLQLLGQPKIVRTVALSIAGMTTETMVQSDHGATLFIRGENIRGVWERTLTTTIFDSASNACQEAEANSSSAPKTPKKAEIFTADGELVTCEAWWEDQGRVHRSWLHGVQKYGGGSFESRRYISEENDGESGDARTVLVCESTFHPRDESREKAKVTWRFLRREAS